MAGNKTPVIPPGLTPSEYEGIFATVGTYQGDDAAYKGKSWGDIYAAMWAANQKLPHKFTPYQIAEKVEIMVLIQGDGQGLVNAVGNFYNITGKSVVGGIDNLFNTPIGTIAQVISKLTSKAFWARVGEFAVGGLLLYVGAKAITTPAGQSVANHSLKNTAVHAVKWVK